MNDETPRGKLKGLRIATTRERAGALDELLAAGGAQVSHIPLIRIAPPEDESPLREALAQVGKYRWVVFTSSNALRMFLQFGGHDAPGVACVGDTTAREAKDAGLNVSLVPERQHVKGLIEAFAGLEEQSGRVLYPRSEIAPTTLKEGLQALGFDVDDPVAYRTLPDETGMQALAQSLDQLDALAFASPSAVENAWSAAAEKLGSKRLYSIGPTTSAALRKHKLEPAGEAATHSAEGLAQAVIEGESNHE
ncbi:MAG: uroporphyrinogen-III synthase [Planctomycetes bacterium]|nr:uroporphyrinogen-III synthase [Planctomycetota bacterium]